MIHRSIAGSSVRRSSICIAWLVVATATCSPVLRGQTRPSVLDMPTRRAAQVGLHQAASRLLARNELPQAAAILRQLILRFPEDAHAHYNLACVLARQEESDEAFASLSKAVLAGFHDVKHMREDRDLAGLHVDPRFGELLESAPVPPEPRVDRRKAVPSKYDQGMVMVDENNVTWDDARQTLRAHFDLQDATADKPIAKGIKGAGELLRKWYAAGTAAGNHGDLYDNHDGDHSNMKWQEFPQLTRIEFADAVKSRQLHTGLQHQWLFHGVVIGNSSTAITRGAYWRSQPRLALTHPRGAAVLHRQYRSNHLYFYPEHRDHDPGHNGADGQGYGDVYSANTPYMVISQGSSGSDRVFLTAVAATLAAFRPQVKEKLKSAGLLMPTVQMLLRAGSRLVTRREEYLTGKAHPTVFDGKQIDIVKMVTLAHTITPSTIPPLAQLGVEQEDVGQVGRDYFDVRPSERIFDSPCAVARVVKSTRYERRMVVAADKSFDVNRQLLSYHWIVLRGDAETIQINRLDATGSRVELVVPYHMRRPVMKDSPMQSNRVDIGLFVNNGSFYSAPALISLYYLDNETRVYDEQQRILSVDYAGPAAKNYVDPRLDLRKDWRDEYQYRDGKLFGWTRIRGDVRQQFTSSGELITSVDDAGQPKTTAPVRYRGRAGKGGIGFLDQIVE